MTEDTTESSTDRGGVYTEAELAEFKEEVRAAADADSSSPTYTCVCGELFLGENAQQRYAAHCRDCPEHTAAREAEGEEATTAAQTDPAPAPVPEPETPEASGGSGEEESTTTPTPDSQASGEDDDGDHSGPALLADDPWALRMLIGVWGLGALGTIFFNYFVHGGHPDGNLELIIAAVLILPLLFFFEMETAALQSVAAALSKRKK